MQRHQKSDFNPKPIGKCCNNPSHWIGTAFERAKYGVSGYDRYSFDHYIMQVLRNYTAHYLKNGLWGVPHPYEEEEWAGILFAIFEGADIYPDMYEWEEGEETERGWEKINLALELFQENITDFWD